MSCDDYDAEIGKQKRPYYTKASAAVYRVEKEKEKESKKQEQRESWR